MIRTSIKLLAPALMLLLASGTSEAQSILSGKGTSMPAYIGELATNVGTGLGQYRSVRTDALDVITPTTIGNVYLTENWVSGELFITLNRLLESNSFKYDIENNQFLINSEKVAEPTPDQLRVINSTVVDAFKLADPVLGERLFINAVNAGLTIEGKPATGFMEVLVSDEGMSLFRKTDTEKISANYNVAFNAGDKNDRIVKKESFYIKNAGQLNLIEISRNKKQNLALFGDKQNAMQVFLKKNNTDFTHAPDLVQLVSYYNSLK
ncbi:hypothetical protein [Pontibacter flavimaris]|uniref:DUF4197 domain-containing protein n=1 Tax=Pontibacter flavimaris TaxID=1797110 RepID=A0A1Q5PAL4_9BACT|nr:hypothetical protein [Pontibacter flavimaris]OKL39243.1 hypothetical protein A3841_04715 [Pontibacter flavimaris]